MITVIRNEPIPLLKDVDGVVRVGDTRVTLDSVISTYHQGATPEEIAIQFDTIQLADIYAVITYYLRHQDEVEAYLSERQTQAQAIRDQNESRFPQENNRARLMARKQNLES